MAPACGWACLDNPAHKNSAKRATPAQSISASCFPPFFRRELHRLDDLRIRRAAAQVARQVMLDLLLVGLRNLVQQLARHHDEARSAEAALEGARLDERFLHGVELLAGLDGLDV